MGVQVHGQATRQSGFQFSIILTMANCLMTVGAQRTLVAGACTETHQAKVGRTLEQKEALELIREIDGAVAVEMMRRMEAAGPIAWDEPIRGAYDGGRLVGGRMLGLACKQGAPEVVRALIQRDCDVNN